MSIRLKLTIVLAQDAVGGTESQVITLVDQLKSFYDVNFWILTDKNSPSIIEAKFKDCNQVNFYYGKNIFRIKKLIRETDIIYSCIINYYWPELLLKLLSNSILFTARRNTYQWRNGGKIYINEIIRNFLTTTVICNSEAVEAQYRKVETYLAPSVVIHNGFQLEKSFEIPKFLEQKFICVGNIKDGKGYKTISKLLSKKNLLHEDVEIFGRVDDQDIASSLPTVTLRGLQDKDSIYSKHCYLLHLSKAEGFPNVIIEALERGIMPIISNIDVHRKLFSNVAIIIDDYDNLVEVIRNIYDRDPVIINRTQANFENYAQLRKQFSSDLYASKFLREIRNAYTIE